MFRETMRAAVRTGGTIEFAADAPHPPSPKSGQVLVSVVAAAINPVDYKLPKLIGGPVAGIDVAGVVDEVGPNVSNLKKGDEVLGFAHGSVSDFATAEAKKLAKKPKALSWEQAAALPTAYLTGYQALTTHGGAGKETAVLVIGASGGCGTAGVALAKALGCPSVVAICSEANAELVTGLGATRVVDYTDAAGYAAFLAEGAKFDLIYDTATNSGKGEYYLGDARNSLLKPGGKIVTINAGAMQWLRLAFGCQSKELRLILTKQNGAELAALVELLGSEYSPPIDSTHKLDAKGVRDGFARLRSRRARGKVVFRVDVNSGVRRATVAGAAGDSRPPMVRMDSHMSHRVGVAYEVDELPKGELPKGEAGGAKPD